VRLSSHKMPVELPLLAAAILANSIAWRCEARSTDGNVNWATGSALQRQLAEPVDVLWVNNPLREAIGNLSRVRRVAVLIDRRVDPGQELNVSLKGVPLESALHKIARRRGLEVSRLGDVVYLGPAAASDRLRAVAEEFTEEIRRLPPAVRRKCLLRKKLSWEDLAAPRDLLAQLGRRSGLSIDHLERIPHDLWAAADLPPLSLADRLTLIAVQFDLTFKVADGGARLELVPLPENAPESTAAERRVAAAAPQEKPTSKPPADLERLRIDRLVVREKPLEAVLRQLAERLDLELRIDREAIAAAGISLHGRVSVKVENATVDDLLRGLLRDTRLTFRRRQRVVEIVPAK